MAFGFVAPVSEYDPALAFHQAAGWQTWRSNTTGADLCVLPKHAVVAARQGFTASGRRDHLARRSDGKVYRQRGGRAYLSFGDSKTMVCRCPVCNTANTVEWSQMTPLTRHETSMLE